MSANSYDDSYDDSFEHLCACCGATIKPVVTKQDGHNESEEYNCPECKKEHSTRASLPILRVIIVSPRTDGKTGNCQE